ncbi:uncharacterized protein LOC142328224 isoform X3 [Lycorma delicatula]|uniref:uncharacterized protein LOC142328224 isoform X3 n=1 Tax=Lycorma delicatula TaxID=130591 RepID=UPI003F5159E6
MPAEDSEMQRRHSSATETSAPHGTDGGLKRHTSQENVELIPTRTTKVATSKPAANPLQFIKVGPCNLYRSAQEQLKKVEEVKKVKKEVRDEAEDWQSNLDDWKCSRRKKQEHIIERVVEVKKLELEEHDRNRRRSKTFSEMMEERNSRGRKLSLPLYQDDDNDLSDLGISTCSKSSSTSSTITEEAQNNDDTFEREQELVSENSTNQKRVNQNGTSLNGHNDEDSSKTSSSETEEYTYERAIQSYVNYAETRGKSRNIRSSSEESNYSGFTKKSPAVPVKPRRGSTPKIEEKLSELEQLKKRSMSTTDLSTGDTNRKQIVVPKVDINKRRELFEKIPDQEESSSKLNHRLSGDFSSSKSIRERLSSFGKQVEESPAKKTINRLSGEISVKDRLSTIEKFQSTENLSTTGKINKGTSENILNAPSVRDRLNSLEKSVNKDIVKTVNTDKIITKEENETISSVESAIENYNASVKSTSGNTDTEFKTENCNSTDSKVNEEENECYKTVRVDEHIERTSSPEDVEIYQTNHQQHFRHRSLDSLDIDSTEGLNNECFERVQSLEDLDFCRNYPASSLSGDTDREDSGIHTADVSSSVSQADDCDSHLDSSSVDTEFKFQHHPTIAEEITRKTIIENSVHSNSEDSSVVITQNNQIGKMEKEMPMFHQNNEESTVLAQESLIRKENNNIKKSDCLKTDSVLNEKNEIYNDTDKCNPVMINNIIDFNQQDSVIVNKSEIVQDNKSQINNSNNINALPVINDRPNFYLDNPCKLPQLNTHNEEDGEIIFPLSPSILEPPKEKPPPPPPSELSDDDETVAPTNKPSSLRRLDSTKRIKKEIRQKRSSFLGLEGGNDDDSLEPELEIQPPPDMTSFLQEERRLEQMMYRQSICSESDSNQGESRDSGVELDRSHHDDIAWAIHNHSRQDSEIFGNASTTSEEEENIKKEREIIDIMKQNDQQTYVNSSQEQENIGEKLALRLRELEAEKTRLEWEREEEVNRRKVEEAARCHQESLIQAREEELRKQENVVCSTEEVSLGDRKQHFTGELLISERERLEREQEELTRQRESLLLQQQWAASLQDVSQQNLNPAESTLYTNTNHDYRRSMPDLQQEPPPRHTRPPPPIPPAKPLVMPRESIRHQDKPVKRTSSPQQMTRQTLQALSAAPRSRLISTDTWIQTKRKPKQENYNYQHWLIQEAEHRRITELQQRQAAVPPRRPAPPHPSAYPGQQYIAPIREAGWQQQQQPSCQQKQQQPQQWASPPTQSLPQGQQWVHGSGMPPRSDKPLPDSIIQTLTQRVQNRINNNPDSSQTINNNRRRNDMAVVAQNVDSQQRVSVQPQQVRMESQQHLQLQQQHHQEKMLSVSGKKKCSHCGEELGRGAAMIIETLRLFYHIDCFKCCVCCVQLGDGLMGTDVRVRNNKLHCQNCYSSDDGVKFSCV